MNKRIIIIGNGIAGVTTARHIRKNSDFEITIISRETKEFFSRTALMYVYMGHMKFEHTVPYESSFWKENRINLILDEVITIDSENKTIQLKENEPLSYDDLIIATGSKPNKFGWPGQDLPQVECMYSKQDLDAIVKHTFDNRCQSAVVVGGGLIGIELAEMLASRNIKVTFLVRENSFWTNVLPKYESEMLNEHIRSHGIDLRLGLNLDSIVADDQGDVRAIKIKETGEEVACQFVGLTTGVSPNIEWLKASNIDTERGVSVNRFLETNIENIYAIGDCAEQQKPNVGRRPIEAVWYTGRMMGETVAQTICGNRTEYNPGHWFNSAKFFDIEYQTYGTVNAEEDEEHKHIHWRASGEEKCMTFAFEPSTRKFLGINTFGIRLRHETFDAWLSEKITVDEVIENLHKANFDPEFYKQHASEIRNHFKQTN